MRGRVREALFYLLFKGLASGMAFGSGLLSIRAVSVQQFGIYSIAVTMIAVIGVIAESGISSTLLRRTSALTSTEDRSAQMRAALTVKSRVTVAVAVPCTVLLVVVLVINRVPVLELLLITVLVVASVGPTLSGSILLVGLQVTDRFRVIRWLDLGNAAVRLALIAVLFLTGTASVGLLLVVSLIAVVGQRVAEAVVLRPFLRGPRPAPGAGARYWRAVRQSLPTSVMMVTGEQLIIVVLTVAGNIAAIGQVGALGRYATVFTLLNSLLMTVIAPMLAHLDADRGGRLRQQAFRVLGLYLVAAAVYVGASALLQDQLVALLGPAYRSLGPELVVISAGIALSNFATYGLGSINHARGWLRWSWTYMPVLAIWLSSALVLPIRSSFGAACFAASLSVPVAVSQGWRLVAGFRALGRGEDEPAPGGDRLVRPGAADDRSG